jgi:hypothetical protein
VPVLLGGGVRLFDHLARVSWLAPSKLV